MKTVLPAIMIAGALLASAAYAADEQRSGPAPAPGVQKPARPGGDDKTAGQMQDHMKKMQDLMERMRKTTDPAARQKLMAEHMAAMREGMDAMRGMGGGMMRGMAGGPMVGQAPEGEAAKPGRAGRERPSSRMMERRMDMMQMMMEQMMQHQQMQEILPK